MQPLPLQVPGGMELAVIARFFFILALPVALVVVLVLLLHKRTRESGEAEATDEELEVTVKELEVTVAELEYRIEELGGDSSE